MLLCGAEDNEWYRAKVLKYASDTRASVSLIDYGNVEDVDLTRMLPISTELLALAAQGIPCCLAGTYSRLRLPCLLPEMTSRGCCSK